MLHEFITVNREEIIRRCRAKVASRGTSPGAGTLSTAAGPGARIASTSASASLITHSPGATGSH